MFQKVNWIEKDAMAERVLSKGNINILTGISGVKLLRTNYNEWRVTSHQAGGGCYFKLRSVPKSHR